MEYSGTMIDILLALGENSLTRKELCKKTGIARTTAYDNLRCLKKLGEVEWVRDGSNGKRGRPKVRWRIA